MVAAGHSIDPARWREAFAAAMGRIAGRFARYEPRLRAGRLVLGLLSDLPRKNCWTIAEWAGEASPHGMQHLLCRAAWDAEAVRDDVREYVVEHLHDDAAVLVVDETGDVKKGTHTVGVQRQYTGTAGRIENSQVAVYLVYAGVRGHAAVDRELYIPRSWTRDPDRCRAAGLGEDTVFVTKPELARTMIERFLEAGHRVGWVTGDEVTGRRAFRRGREATVPAWGGVCYPEGSLVSTSRARFARAMRVPLSLSVAGTASGIPSCTTTTSVPSSASDSVVVIVIVPRSAGSAVSNSNTSTTCVFGTNFTKWPW
ncbi:hypothetical protein GCM10027162_67470 [Streptomyces incanus]